MYFVFMYENRTMKPVKIVLRREGRGMRKNHKGVSLIKTYSKHICKCHNVSSLYNYSMLIKKTESQKLLKSL
jgi:hypothetical protein